MTSLIHLIVFAAALQVGALRIQPKTNLATAQSESDVNDVECLRTDGFGAQYLCQMAVFAHARYTGDCFVLRNYDKSGFHADKHSAFDPVATRLTSEFDPVAFTGLESDDPSKCTGTKELFKSGTHVKNASWWTQETRNELRSLYEKNPKPKLDDQCDVAFHVRRGDVMDPRKDILFPWRMNSDNFGTDLIRFVPNNLIRDVILGAFNDTKKVCIISQGKEEDFGDIRKLKNVEFKLKDTPDVAFHRLVSAPAMVLSPSQFGYPAAILSKGKVYNVPRQGDLTKPGMDQRQVMGMPLLPEWINIFCRNGVCTQREVGITDTRNSEVTFTK